MSFIFRKYPLSKLNTHKTSSQCKTKSQRSSQTLSHLNLHLTSKILSTKSQKCVLNILETSIYINFKPPQKVSKSISYKVLIFGHINITYAPALVDCINNQSTLELGDLRMLDRPQVHMEFLRCDMMQLYS